MASNDATYGVEWAENLKVSGNPNRVFDTGALEKGAPARTRENSQVPAADGQGEHSYYDLSMLKAPVWKWEIASYFFLGGLSAGAYLIARAADRFDGQSRPSDSSGARRYENLSRTGANLALLTLLPCPALLIHDLGDPKRFHHMLRVWKPGSPMNLGSWSLVGYGGMVGFEVLRRFFAEHRIFWSANAQRRLLKLMNHRALLLLHDAAGIPFAILIAGYTGVLLSCTANPLWCKNPWLAPLFTASAISTGAEALSLALDVTGSACECSQRILQNIDTAAHTAEAVTEQGFMKYAGEKAKTLHSGKQAKVMKFAKTGIVAAEVLKRLPVRDGLRKPVRMFAAALGLASGFALRWAMVHGGHEAANDPRTARLVSKPKRRAVKTA